MERKTALQMILTAAKAAGTMCYQDDAYRVYVRDSPK